MQVVLVQQLAVQTEVTLRQPDWKRRMQDQERIDINQSGGFKMNV